MDRDAGVLSILDRESGDIVEETIYGRAALEFAYHTKLGRALMGVAPQKALSSLYGWMARLPSSKAKIRGFVESLGIDGSEAEHPIDAYRSLDEFFCRRLKPEARPLDMAPDRFVSPADGRMMVFPLVSDHEFVIKGCRVNLTELIGDAATAEPYANGTAVVVRLAPCDYHRFHFPASGTASTARSLSGRLHSVHPFALQHGAPSFRNQRALTRLETKVFGSVLLVEVGAFAVGSIVQTFVPGPVEKGQEKGYFRFGGSTVVVLFPPGRIVVDEDLVTNSGRGLETFVKMGASIGTATS